MRGKDAARFMNPVTGEIRSAHLDADGWPVYSDQPIAEALEYDPKPSMFDLVRAEVARTLAARQEEMPTLRELLDQAEFLASDEDESDDTALSDYEVDRLASLMQRSRERDRIIAAVTSPNPAADRPLPTEAARPTEPAPVAPARDDPPNPRAPGALPQDDR